MRPGLPAGTLLIWSRLTFADPCLLGPLQSYIDLIPGGCTVGSTVFADFATEPGQSFATPFDPARIQVAPFGTSEKGAWSLTLNADALAPDLLESFFRFDIAEPNLSRCTHPSGMSQRQRYCGSGESDRNISTESGRVAP
jgi:hypothetical protein